MELNNKGMRFMRNHLVNKNRFLSRKAKYPSYAFITIESICNSRCNYCDMWKTKKGNQPSTQEWKKIIDDIRALGVVSLTFSGGEPFLNKGLFELAEYAKSKGLVTMVVTNLSLFKKDWLEKISKSFDFFGVSIDSTKPKVYKELRGVNWLVKNKKNIHKIMESLAKQKAKTSVCAMVTVSSKNANELHDILHMVFDDLKMDGISFNLLDAQGSKTAKYFKPNENQIKFYKQVILDHKKNYPIANSTRFISQAGSFDYKCNPWKSIQIDHEGYLVTPCLLLGTKKINLRKNGLKDVWNQKSTQEVYEKYSACKTCNLGCVIESAWATYDLPFTINEILRGTVLPTLKRVNARNEGKIKKKKCSFTYS
ncbi:MAG: radical SAM protein [Candidatus Diapherotrites archaeon]|nr:radical SAM protein [Candidatus Diapherotrites archaeon]